MYPSFLDELGKIATAEKREGLGKIADAQQDAMRKARLIQKDLAKKYKTKPYLAGSLALGTNVPGDFDFDYGITAQNTKRFDALAKQLGSNAKSSQYNKGDQDYRVFATKIRGEPVDIALILGGKGAHHRDAVKRVSLTLNEDQRRKIVEEKKRLQGAWVFKKHRYKAFKRETDERLGIPRFSRDTVLRGKKKEAERNELARKDVFGHRTSNLEPIINSGRILSAARAQQLGLLGAVESRSHMSRGRVDPSEAEDLRTSISITRGLLPAESSYGPYGVMFRSRKATPSTELKTIPTEHKVDNEIRGKMTFVVPDREKEQWQKKYPTRQVVGESDVPEGKRLASSSYTTLLKRMAGRLGVDVGES